MSLRKTIVGAAVVLAGAGAFAHHVAVPLSHPFGEEILTRIVFFAQSGNLGVPAYHVGTDEHEVDLPDLASFSASDGSTTEVVVLHHDDGDHHLSLHDYAHQINEQLTIGAAVVENESIVIRGVAGGATTMLELTDGAGTPLELLGFHGGMLLGDDDIRLTLSLPADDHEHEGEHGDDHEHGFAHHPYVVLMSTTPGEILVDDGYVVPVGFDTTLVNGLRAIEVGLLPTFVGTLDENEDAEAVLPRNVLFRMFPQGLPDELYLTFVVLDEVEPTVWYTSNVFTVDIVE